MTKILIIAEHDGGALNPSTAKCVTCATKFDGADVTVAVLGTGIGDVAAEAAKLSGVGRVITVDRQENEAALAAILAPQVVSLAADYSHIMGPSTAFGKDLMPRVAALLGVNQVSDIMSVEGDYCFKRPIYAGNAVVTVDAPAEHKLVATVRTASFQAAEGGNSAPIEQVDTDAELPSHSRFVELQTGQSDRPDLQSATRVVAGGRALASTENFQLIYKLADSIGAAVGSSRAAVDASYVPPETQVGQTGQIIAPDLYIAVGISGAIQHITGIKDAGTIVAINKDEEAPIFEIADIGLVGDLFKIVPELTDALS
ncbi:MAG: electron transfer flavoprotein subunit alpha/FixB family protein [Gammaproteobacteria bacterium]|nr:electron transfer flavoprotein subunit alpha/FixB family protein [Gammaproteobacteria bacterium]